MNTYIDNHILFKNNKKMIYMFVFNDLRNTRERVIIKKGHMARGLDLMMLCDIYGYMKINRLLS